MQFTVREWMNDLVVSVEPESSVSEALALMRRRYIHSLLVSKSKDHPQYGILTSTDVSDKIVAQGRNPSRVQVWEIMTSPLVTVMENVTLQQCAEVMKKHHIHHLPVVNMDGDVLGMVSDTDFLVAAEAMGREPGDRIV